MWIIVGVLPSDIVVLSVPEESWRATTGERPPPWGDDFGESIIRLLIILARRQQNQQKQQLRQQQQQPQGQKKVSPCDSLEGCAALAQTLQYALRLHYTRPYTVLSVFQIFSRFLWRFLTDFGSKSRHLVVSANQCDRIATASEKLRLGAKREADALRKYQKCPGKYRRRRKQHKAAI